MGTKIYGNTVEPVLTHTFRWTAQAMGYHRLWDMSGVLKINHIKTNTFGPGNCLEIISAAHDITEFVFTGAFYVNFESNMPKNNPNRGIIWPCLVTKHG